MRTPHAVIPGDLLRKTEYMLQFRLVDELLRAQDTMDRREITAYCKD